MLKINAGPETAAVLERTRRAMNDLQSSVKRVASGISIESAADDPGAIGSVVLTETAISGVQRTLRNLNEGITITQALTEDLNLVEDLLRTLREVAEQAASDQFTDAQRAQLQVDAQSLLHKIDTAVRAAGSEYGVSLTQNDSITIKSSPELSLNTQIVLTDLLVEDLGKRAIYTSQRNGVFTSALEAGALTINGVTIRPTTTDDDSVSTTANDGSAIAKALAINTATYLTGVTAEAGPTSITGNRPVSAIELTGLNYFSINGSVINGISIGENDNLDASLREAINAETKYTGVTATRASNGALTLTAEDGRNIYIRYSNQDVLNAIGVTDKEGDLANMFGEVGVGDPDRALQGEVQLPITIDFQSAYLGNVSVGGRFDAPQDYVDFVAHVVKEGGFGVAEIRVDRDPTSELTPVEDFAFIEGSVDPVIDSSGVSGDFFSTGGFGVGTGEYNEGLDREYIITATKAGTTDGDIRAEFEVTTAQGDGVVGTFVAEALVDIPIAGAYTGEDVTLFLSESSRNSSLSSVDAAGHEYDSTVTIGGTYDGTSNSVTTVEVVTSGRTQGAPQAEVQVYHDGVAFGGVLTVDAGVALDIGNGQTLTFDEDLPNFGEVIETVTGTYLRDVTLNSDPADFTGLGAATYTVEVTQAGSVDEAQYIVKRDGVTVTAAAILNSGTVTVADGLTFNFPDAPPVIGSTTVTTAHAEDEVDHFQDYAGAQFVGTYDGSLGETTLDVRVKSEGIVLASGDSEVGRSDYAILEYRFGSDPFAGSITAVEGTIDLDFGIQFSLPAPSAEMTLIDPTGVDYGNAAALPVLSVGGYNGTVAFGLDRASFTYGEDVKVVFSSANSMQIPTTNTQTEDLTVKLISENTGTLLASTVIQPVSGVTYSIGEGITLSLTNLDGANASLVGAVTNNDFGTIGIAPGSDFSGITTNEEVLFTFNNTTDVNITRTGVGANEGVGVTVGANVYNGIYGDKTITLQLTTNSVATIDQLTSGTDGLDDDVTVSLEGAYNGTNAGDDIRLDFLNRLTVNVDADAGNDDGAFSIAPSISGSNDINRAYADLTLDISVEKTVEVEPTSTPADVSVIGTANGSFYGDFMFWRVNASKFRIEATPFGGVKSTVEVRFNDYVVGGVLDLGDPAFTGVFGGSDPGFDLDVSSAAVGQQYHFTAREVFSYTFTDGGGASETVESVGGVIDLGSGPLATTFFNEGDPDFDLIVSNEDEAVDDSFQLSWTIDPTVVVYRQSGGARQAETELTLELEPDRSVGRLDMGDPALLAAGIFDIDPNITLVVENPDNAVDDTFGLLGISPTVNFTDGINTVTGLARLTSYTLSDPSLAALFPDGSPGDVVINLTAFNPNKPENDSYDIDLVSDSTVSVSNPDGSGSTLVTVAADGTIDLGQAAVTGLMSGGDPGFDLVVTDLDRGIDDQYTLSLSALPQLNAQADEEIILVNQHSLQVGDLFSTSLATEAFAVGDQFSAFVESEHLQDGTVYTITNTLGQFNVGDVIKVNTTHDFQAPTYVVDSSVSILNGLTLDFDQDRTFEVGDEIRFQVRGYTGNPIASGTYTNAISPATFTIEITSTGDVDGGATFQYTRSDTGEVVTGLSVTSSPTLLDDGVYVEFTAGRVYLGDQFFVEAYESLNQTFGGQLTLSSTSSFTLEMADVETDNFLGRVAYSGDTPTAPGTDGNVTSAFLALNRNTAVGQVDLRTQAKAERSVVYTGNAQDSLRSYQQRLALTQAEMQDISHRLEDTLVQQEDLLRSKLKVDAEREGERSTKAIAQLASNAMLSSVGEQKLQNPLSLLQQSLVAPSPPTMKQMRSLSEEIASKKAETPRVSDSTQSKQTAKRERISDRIEEQNKRREASAQRVQAMISSIEATKQRSAAAIASASALRQLNGANVDVQSVEAELAAAQSAGETTPAPTSGSLNKLLGQISKSSRVADTASEVARAREEVQAAERLVREMKEVALAAQVEPSSGIDSLQGSMDDLVRRLKEQTLPKVESSRGFESQFGGPNTPLSSQNKLVFDTSTSRQLGSFSTEQSQRGVNSKMGIADGDLLIQTASGLRVPVRGTLPTDDPYSVRDQLGSAISKASVINASSDRHGVSALAGPTVTFSDQSVAQASLVNESFLRINGVEISGINVKSGDSDGALATAINAVSDQTGVQATAARGGRLRLSATDGRNITVDAYGEATKLGFTPTGAGRAETRTTGGALTVSSRSFFTFSSTGLGGEVSDALGGLSLVPVSLSLNELDVSTSQGRLDALTIIDLALNDLARLRKTIEG